MSQSAQILPPPAAVTAESAQARTRRRGGPSWVLLGWFVVLCLALLGQNAQRQLAMQRQLLAGSQELAQLVAESRAVSVTLKTQMGRVQELDQATGALDRRLAQVAAVNAGVRTQVRELEGTVQSILDAVAGMGQQAQRSRELLQSIGTESQALQEVLEQSRQIGAQVSAELAGLAELQEALNADLAEMEEKTRALDRFTGEN